MKEIFKTKSFKTLIITLIILIMLSGFSAVFDTNIISSSVGFLTVGMQRVSAAVTENNTEKSYDELLYENQQLKKELSNLRTQLSDYMDVKEENARLWKYYDLKKKNDKYNFVPVSVIRRDASAEFYSFTVDRGSNENISVNDPVVSENGLVGYVKEVSVTYCIVTTILSPDLSAGAKDVISKDTGIITGDAEYSDKNLVTMKKLAENNKIKVGDQISTTGIGGMFPENVSVGTVKELKYDDFDTSLYAVIEPYEDIQNVTDVVIVTSFEGQGEIAPAKDKEASTKSEE
ncbi:MAG: rod shape-determining protein MreC [Oscillospiraceae bacterium]|nr:rod shape-determining protein MreC [Oscillospiraceae bacterium]